MKNKQAIHPIMVTNGSQWETIAQTLNQVKALAVDLEGNGFFRYPEHICLIQLCAEEQVFLLDPLAVKDLSLLGKILNHPGIVKIFHSCDWDLRSLDRDYGYRVKTIFDTSIAARFLGLNEVGLGKVLKHFLEVEVDKSKSLQRQDWTLRPINLESVQYAARDVYFLPHLHTRMLADLKELGRDSWVEEECRRMEQLRFVPSSPPQEAFWNIKGCRALTKPQIFQLRDVCVFREKLARQFNRPPFKIVSDQTLLELVKNPTQDLAAIRGLTVVARAGLLAEMAKILQSIAAKESVIRPFKPKGNLPPRLNAQDKKRLLALKKWRQTKGEQLGLDPALLWPMRSLEIIAQFPEKQQGEFKRQHPHCEVRAWQAREFAGELEQLGSTFEA